MDATNGNNSLVPTERIADHGAKTQKAKEELELTKKQDELISQFINEYEATLRQKEEIAQREAAKDQIHDDHHAELMAILEETNAINKRIIQKLMTALEKKKLV